jgi:flagellar biosynthesis protein
LPYRDDHRDPFGAYERRKVAVALSYELGGETLPKIVATGSGSIAERIVALAFANGVKVREDRELAQLLATMELDSEIPTEAIMAVAEILSYLYQAGELRRREASERNAGEAAASETGPAGRGAE